MAEPVRIVFGNDLEGVQAQGDISGNLFVRQGTLDAANKTYEDTSFVTGDSPQTHDFNTDAGRNATDGYIVCDGPGNIQVDISRSVSFDAKWTMKAGEVVSLRGLNIGKIRVTWVTNSAYRINLI